jgi:CheY-like chemotaxis protein
VNVEALLKGKRRGSPATTPSPLRDIRIPVSDGLATTQQIRQRTPSAAVLTTFDDVP